MCADDFVPGALVGLTVVLTAFHVWSISDLHQARIELEFNRGQLSERTDNALDREAEAKKALDSAEKLRAQVEADKRDVEEDRRWFVEYLHETGCLP